MINKKKIIDGDGHQINIEKNDFTLVQGNEKIHDLSFKTKPTTFLKDALKRFVKSKPAIVGTAIVGLLAILAIIVPFCTPNEGVYNVQQGGGGNLKEAFLTPKLFDRGSGFWDGTLKRSDILYDKTNEVPVGYREGTFFNLSTYDRLQNGLVNVNGSGGSVNFYSINDATKVSFYSSSIPFSKDSTYHLSYTLLDKPYDNYKFYGYKLSLFDGENHYYLLGDADSYSKELNVDLSIYDKLKENKVDYSNLENAQIYFELAPSEDDYASSVLISSLNINSSKEEENTLLNEVSFKDGNSMLLKEAGSSGAWITLSGKSAYQVKFTYCNFTYDQYEDVYGKVDANYGYRDILIFQNNNSFEVNFPDLNESYQGTTDQTILNERFKVTNPDLCPISEVVEQVGTAEWNNQTKRWDGYSLKAKVYNYKVLGYKTMPKFFFGTNGSSKDYLKLMFTGLRFSLLLAIFVSAINIIIGLIWGSISGYYGGWTDIIMERFCDILSGLPTMVIITLCILYGREFNWGSGADVIALMVALFLTGWMGVSSRTRTQFYRFKGREYVLASRTLGAKDGRLIFKHILPNAAGTIITSSVLMIPSVIYTETSIAYLGLGLQNQVLFGVILAEANTYYSGDKAFLLFIPTLVMVFLLVSFNLFGNGLRDAFNPSLKGAE